MKSPFLKIQFHNMYILVNNVKLFIAHTYFYLRIFHHHLHFDTLKFSFKYLIQEHFTQGNVIHKSLVIYL